MIQGTEIVAKLRELADRIEKTPMHVQPLYEAFGTMRQGEVMYSVIFWLTAPTSQSDSGLPAPPQPTPEPSAQSPASPSPEPSTNTPPTANPAD